jgi:uncharacterized protein (TIRG00374 family)
MTRKKYWMVLSGSLLSLLLLVLVFSRLDWKAFQESFTQLHLPILGVSALFILLSVTIRGLRWHLITGLKLKQFKYVWQATNIGYLGNMIYPVRAGEVLRIITLQHLTGLRFGNVLSSSVIDRILDVIMLGFSSLLVLWLHRGNLDTMLVEKIEYSILGISSLAISSLLLTVIYVESLHVWVEQGAFWKRFPRLLEWLIHGLDGVRVFRRSPHPLLIVLLSIFAFVVDFFWMWQVMFAFGWDLPLETAITVGVFITIGAALPSAPGYLGVYQVACILALQLYNQPQAPAVAYSIILQLLYFLTVGLQGAMVMLFCGFNIFRIAHSRDTAPPTP